MKKHRPAQPAQAISQTLAYEADVVEGLEAIAADEIRRLFASRAQVKPSRKGAVPFTYSGDFRDLHSLKTVQAVYRVSQFQIPRPKALLGDTNIRIVINTIKNIVNLNLSRYQTLHISAAGSESSVMQRLRETITRQTGLKSDPDEGDLLLRIRRTPDANSGWDVLTRITPRPLATRAWRICNYEGALNATVAHAMVLMTQPHPSDLYVNIGAGSGTLLIERAAWGRASVILGVDRSEEALTCTQDNIHAVTLNQPLRLCQGDVRQLPLPPRYADVLTADLPFGQLVGSHRENAALYPTLLSEAARIAKPDARFVLITHEVRLMETLLSEQTDWELHKQQMITLRGLHPRIYVLRRQVD